MLVSVGLAISCSGWQRNENRMVGQHFQAKQNWHLSGLSTRRKLDPMACFVIRILWKLSTGSQAILGKVFAILDIFEEALIKTRLLCIKMARYH